MAEEIELKFQVPAKRLAGVVAALHALPGGVQRLPLQARYLDTPGAHLAAARIALRQRREGPRWVQTLKADGGDGLRRLEHNLPLDRDGTAGSGGAGGAGGADAACGGDQPAPADPARHAGHPAGERLLRLLADLRRHGGDAALRTVYGTDVQRTLAVVTRHGARVELALDEGWITAGALREPLCELELELLDGPVAGLLDAARSWCGRHGLWLDVRSKAERGVALAQRAGQLPAGGVSPAWPAERPAQALQACLAAASALAGAGPGDGLPAPGPAPGSPPRSAPGSAPPSIDALSAAARHLARTWPAGGAAVEDLLQATEAVARSPADAPAALRGPAWQTRWLDLLAALHAPVRPAAVDDPSAEG